MPPEPSAPTASQRLKPLFDRTVGLLTVGSLKAPSAINRDAMAKVAAGATRTIGPRLKEHRIGRENLAAAFPGKTDERDRSHLARMWDNLGRVAAEFAHIDRMQMHDPTAADRRHPLHAADAGALPAAARRRQAGADLHRASCELGIAGAGRGPLRACRARCSTAARTSAQSATRCSIFAPARWHDGRDRSRRAGKACRRARLRRSRRHAGRPVLRARRRRDLFRAADQVLIR